MAATVTDSVQVASTSAANTLESGTLTPTGSNKAIWAWVMSGDNTPGTVTACKYASSGGTGGESMTQRATVFLSSNGNLRLTLFELKAPSAASGTVWAQFSTSDSERCILAVACQDVDQTTPTGTIATATNTTNTPTVNVTSVAGDLVLDGLWCIDYNGANFTIAVGAGQTSLEEVENGACGPYEDAGSSWETAAGTTTTMSWTMNSVGATEWGLIAFAVNAAAAGGGDLDLVQTANVAVTGTLGITGDVQDTINFAPSAAVAPSGVLAITGDIQIQYDWAFEPPLTLPTLAGTVGVTGDLQVGVNLAPSAAVAVAGVAAVAGDLQILTGGPFDAAATAPIAGAGTVGVTGDIQIGTSFDVEPSGAVAVTGSAAVTGDVQAVVPFDVAPSAALAVAGLLAVVGNLEHSTLQPRGLDAGPVRSRRRFPRFYAEDDEQPIVVPAPVAAPAAAASPPAPSSSAAPAAAPPLRTAVSPPKPIFATPIAPQAPEPLDMAEALLAEAIAEQEREEDEAAMRAAELLLLG